MEKKVTFPKKLTKPLTKEQDIALGEAMEKTNAELLAMSKKQKDAYKRRLATRAKVRAVKLKLIDAEEQADEAELAIMDIWDESDAIHLRRRELYDTHLQHQRLELQERSRKMKAEAKDDGSQILQRWTGQHTEYHHISGKPVRDIQKALRFPANKSVTEPLNIAAKLNRGVVNPVKLWQLMPYKEARKTAGIVAGGKA